jgi:hypothetical protein
MSQVAPPSFERATPFPAGELAGPKNAVPSAANPTELSLAPKPVSVRHPSGAVPAGAVVAAVLPLAPAVKAVAACPFGHTAATGACAAWPELPPLLEHAAASAHPSNNPNRLERASIVVTDLAPPFASGSGRVLSAI